MLLVSVGTIGWQPHPFLKRIRDAIGWPLISAVPFFHDPIDTRGGRSDHESPRTVRTRNQDHGYSCPSMPKGTLLPCKGSTTYKPKKVVFVRLDTESYYTEPKMFRMHNITPKEWMAAISINTSKALRNPHTNSYLPVHYNRQMLFFMYAHLHITFIITVGQTDTPPRKEVHLLRDSKELSVDR